MSAPQDNQERKQTLEDILVSEIRQNENNPRIHFPPEELERLTESIDTKGILVPLAVYRDNVNGGYVLIDGERRWRCAQELGLERVPAVISEPTTPEQNLVQMFNIHMVREPWRDMPTAWAMKRLMEESGVSDARQLSDLTGLSMERVRRLKHALDLPEEYQKYIDEGLVPLNWFWELRQNVTNPLESSRPDLWTELGGEAVRDAFVAKRLDGVITDTVSLRDVRPIIRIATSEAASTDAGTSILDDTIRDLVRDKDLTIAQAYEDSVQVVVEADKLERRTNNMLKSFERLMSKAKTDEELDHVKGVGGRLIEKLGKILNSQ